MSYYSHTASCFVSMTSNTGQYSSSALAQSTSPASNRLQHHITPVTPSFPLYSIVVLATRGTHSLYPPVRRSSLLAPVMACLGTPVPRDLQDGPSLGKSAWCIECHVMSCDARAGVMRHAAPRLQRQMKAISAGV